MHAGGGTGEHRGISVPGGASCVLPEVEVTTRTPRVTIGLPVYNGEDFLESALDTLLAQTYTDFELVIADNASTDRTGEICRRAARDARVRYHRNDENVGAMRNFNRVFELARGEYFMWAAHDDAHEPDYLRRCVSPSAAGAMTRATE